MGHGSDPGLKYPASILELAKRGDMALLAEECRVQGIPVDTFEEAKAGELPDSGEVLLQPEGRQPVKCSYDVLAGDVLVVAGAFKLCVELIAAAEAVAHWRQGSQVESSGSSYTSDKRTSSNARLSCGLREFMEPVRALAREAGRFYGAVNPHASWGSDSGFEIVRYEVGQRFDLHVDHIVGRPESQRQLTVLVYLNDDYEGGQTTFPRQGVTLEPGVGDVVVFPPWPTHPHESVPVTRGTKYVLVGWLLP